MRKLKAIGALTLVLSLTIGTTVFAAPSPKSSVIWALITPSAQVETVDVAETVSSNSSSSTAVSVPAEDVKAQGAPVVTEAAGPLALASLSATVTADAARLGLTPVVKTVKNVIAPAGYVPGTPVTLTWAVAGLADGTQLFAYYLTENGTIFIAPVSVKGGYATFTVTSLRAVALVEYVSTPAVEVAGLH